MTVWRQAERNKVPTIAFLNKMDKPNANFEMSLASMERKLNCEPLIHHCPVGQGKNFRGVVDLVEWKVLLWDYESARNSGRGFKELEMADDKVPKDLWNQAVEMRTKLVDRLCDFDEEIADIIISEGNYEKVPSNLLKKTLRKVTISPDNNCMATLCGSAFKNIGVQPLMDAVLEYLPSPNDLSFPFLSYYGQNFCGLAFKTLHHKQKGLLTFVRVYGGTLTEGTTVYNMSKAVNERVGKLMVAFADDFKAVKAVTEGNIAVISGLKDTSTGDTLVLNSAVAKDVIERYKKVEDAVSPYLPGVETPDPVFYCSIEAPSAMYQKSLDVALANLSKEDPSLRVTQNEDTGQTVLSGMGELHLEIILDRIRKEYNVDADFGQLMIAYRETPTLASREFIDFERELGGKKQIVKIDLEVIPDEKRQASSFVLSKSKDSVESLALIRSWQMKALKKGFHNAIECGPLLQYPILMAKFVLHGVEISRQTTDTMISAAMMKAVKTVMASAESRLLEPVMKLEITAEEDVYQKVLQDLLKKRGELLSTEDRLGSTILVAEAPLSQLRGYSRHIRTFTSGKAFFGMEFSHYRLMEETDQNDAIEEVTGFYPS